MITEANYRAYPAVSNSDLSWLNKQCNCTPDTPNVDLVKVFANGTLVDALITEPHKVNTITYQVAGEKYQYSAEEFEEAKAMKKAFMADPLCADIVKNCKFQHISFNPAFPIEHQGYEFTLPAKCKWDLFNPNIDLGGDIKTTACTTQKQCEEAVRFFDYDRSRAWYMDLENRSNDVLIFISKVNHQIFKVPVKKGGELYNEGKAKYKDLAFKWHLMFEI